MNEREVGTVTIPACYEGEHDWRKDRYTSGESEVHVQWCRKCGLRLEMDIRWRDGTKPVRR